MYGVKVFGTEGGVRVRLKFRDLDKLTLNVYWHCIYLFVYLFTFRFVYATDLEGLYTSLAHEM